MNRTEIHSIGVLWSSHKARIIVRSRQQIHIQTFIHTTDDGCVETEPPLIHAWIVNFMVYLALMNEASYSMATQIKRWSTKLSPDDTTNDQTWWIFKNSSTWKFVGGFNGTRFLFFFSFHVHTQFCLFLTRLIFVASSRRRDDVNGNSHSVENGHKANVT